MKPFSPATIVALAEVVTGGSSGDPSPSIGNYRSGPKLDRFFSGLNIQFSVGTSSRVPAVHDMLTYQNRQPGGRDVIVKILEATADPRDFFDNPEKLLAVVGYLNKRLSYDGCELRKEGKIYRVFTLGTGTVAAQALKEKANVLRLESVQIDFERALAQADRDPSGAITAACSMVESVCKCILDEMSKPYPANKDIQGLMKEVAKYLNLSPGRKDLPIEWEQDIRQVLGGLFSVVGGIGALRTHAGDAHGKGMNPFQADPRIARLAIHAASTVSLFYIESWQRASNSTVAKGKTGT